MFDTLPGTNRKRPPGEISPGSVAVSEAVAALQARGVRYAAVSFVDLHGKTKAKMVPIAHLLLSSPIT